MGLPVMGWKMPATRPSTAAIKRSQPRTLPRSLTKPSDLLAANKMKNASTATISVWPTHANINICMLSSPSPKRRRPRTRGDDITKPTQSDDGTSRRTVYAGNHWKISVVGVRSHSSKTRLKNNQTKSKNLGVSGGGGENETPRMRSAAEAHEFT